MKSIGIYIHVPFCRGKCPYCDFYSVNLSEQLITAYTDETIRRIHELKPYEVTADTIYFGGGTPSLLGGYNIERIMSELNKCVKITSNAEITVEANPSSDLGEFLHGCSAAGVNRLSLGMQSAVPRELAAIGRRHSPDDVLSAMERAHSVGIDNISLDLMLGIPYQTSDSLNTSLEFISQSAPSHVSAYMLKIEEGTPFYDVRNSLIIPDDDGMADLYKQAFSTLEGFGYSQYEISNAARNGKISRHNMKYWNCDEYIGLGPAAHGFFMGKRYFFGRSLTDYLNGVRPKFDCPGGAADEYIMLRLRLAEGITESGMKERFNHGISEKIRHKAKKYEKPGLCRCSAEEIALTRKGMLVSNYIIADLLSD
ncbi:MAG: radical SAM family heme chaperone HemW [Firmicutes bacterium]|nr:radical SAM family heme chaperone HemW [Bacillota bacterium]